MDAFEACYFEPLQNPKKKKKSDSGKYSGSIGKLNFAALVRDAKSVARFSPYRQFRVGRNDVT